MAEFEIDPEFRDLLPALSQDEFDRLRDDINKNGCRDSLVVWREWNLLIDGHNRHEICTTLDMPYETVEMSFSTRDDVKLWMIRNQLARRNISDAMRVVLNLKLKPVLAAKAKENQKLSPGQPEKGLQNSANLKDKPADSVPQNSAKREAVEKLDTRAEIAKASGVSHDTVHKVEAVMAKAEEPVKAKMLAGEISVNAAYKEITETDEDRAKANAFLPRWQSLFGTFTKKTRELCELTDAQKQVVSHQLRTFAKEFDK